MERKVTSTITTTEGIVTVANKETMQFETIPYTVYGELNDEQYTKTTSKYFSFAKNLVFVKAEKTNTSSVKLAMRESQFINLSKSLSDKDSKVDKITRTIYVLVVECNVANKETLTFERYECFIDKTDDDALIEKKCKKQCEALNKVFVNVVSKKLYCQLKGMSKSDFIKNAEVVIE